jgi:hypothetical protein
MPEFVAQQDEIVARFPLADVTGEFSEIQPRDEEYGILWGGVIPSALPGRISDHALLLGMIY